MIKFEKKKVFAYHIQIILLVDRQNTHYLKWAVK